MECLLQLLQHERRTGATEDGRFLQGRIDCSDQERWKVRIPIPTQMSSIFEGAKRVASRVACVVKSNPIGDRTKQMTESHPEQSVEEFVNGDAVELALLCSTHSSAFSEGYDHVL